MAQTSPILRFALEVLHHALENYVTDTPRHRKLAVLHLAQAVELTIKAALVERNVPIYEKNGRTLNSHDALRCLADLWEVERIDHHARVELLIDERNAIQHRYGNVDNVSLDYHMETTFDAVAEILNREFDTDLSSWIRDTVEEAVWSKVRFVATPMEPTEEEPSAAIRPERSPVLDFVDGFARFERQVRALLAAFLNEGQRFTGSTLDFSIKALSNADEPNPELITSLPDVYKLRNRSVHGDSEPTGEEVDTALRVLDATLAALKALPEDVQERATRASMRGLRGTHLPTRLEEAQADFADEVDDAPQPNEDEAGV